MPSQIGKLNSIALRSDFKDPLHGYRGRRCIQFRNPAITLRKPVSAQSSSTVPQSSCSRCRRTASVFSWLTIMGLGKTSEKRVGRFGSANARNGSSTPIDAKISCVRGLIPRARLPTANFGDFSIIRHDTPRRRRSEFRRSGRRVPHMIQHQIELRPRAPAFQQLRNQQNEVLFRRAGHFLEMRQPLAPSRANTTRAQNSLDLLTIK